jgi:hypothetical protein
VGVLLTINIFFLLSNFLLDRGQCGQYPSVACLINTNRGLWTFGAMCVASITLYVNARMKQITEGKAEMQRQASAYLAIIAAWEELVHNLQHFSREINDANGFITFPATTFDETYYLCNQELSLYVARDATEYIRILQRITSHNRATLRSIGEIDPDMKLISIMDEIGIVGISKTEWLSHMTKSSKENKDEVDKPLSSVAHSKLNSSPLNRVHFDQRIITHSIHCFMAIAYYHPKAVTQLLKHPNFKWLAKHCAGSGYGHHYQTKSSDVTEAEAAAIRSEGAILYCWIKDVDIDDVEIVPIRMAFRDLAHTCS